VKDMIGQAIGSFANRHRAENEEFRHSMQEVITTQFSSLGASLIQKSPTDLTKLV